MQWSNTEFFAGSSPILTARISDTRLLLQFFERFGAQVVDGGWGGSSRGTAATAAGRWKSRVAHTHDNLFGLQAEQIRCNHRDHRFGAGAEVLRAAANLDAAVGIDLGFGFGASAAAAPGCAGTTNARFDDTRRAAGFLVFLFPPEPFRTELVFLSANLARIVFDTQLDRVNYHFPGELRHDGLHAERSGGMPRGAERAGRARVDGDAGLLHAGVGDLIDIWRRKQIGRAHG